jgi:hypothetical protein
MKNKNKVYTILFATFLVLSLACVSSFANAAASISLSQSTQAAGGTVTVSGTGFGANKSVAIGFGAEVVVTGEAHTPTGTGSGPYMTQTLHYPLKPGAFSFHSNVGGTESDWTDKGDGTFSTTSAYDAGSYLNYATGAFGRSSTADLTGMDITFTASYTYYQYNLTAASGITTSATGTFTATITVPATMANGNYNVTVFDTAGNKGVQVLTVGGVIPEGISVEAAMLAAVIAVAAAAIFLKKRQKI